MRFARQAQYVRSVSMLARHFLLSGAALCHGALSNLMAGAAFCAVAEVVF